MLTDGQKAQIYLNAKGLNSSDFSKIMGFSRVRASQLLQDQHSSVQWTPVIKRKVKELTHGGLDIDSEDWNIISAILEKMPDPVIDAD